MKKKSSKKLTPKKSPKEQLMVYTDKLKATIADHGVFLMFIIAGLSIGFSLYKARTYLNPIRDETKYSELTANNNYSKIDYNIVSKLSAALEDTDVQANKNIDPKRSNPFSE